MGVRVVGTLECHGEEDIHADNDGIRDRLVLDDGGQQYTRTMTTGQPLLVITVVLYQKKEGRKEGRKEGKGSSRRLRPNRRGRAWW